MTKKSGTSAAPERTLFRHTETEWRLVSNNADNSDDDLNFILSGEHYLGRLDCEILLSDPHSSRRHAKLTLIDDEVLLEDLKSSNGTFVNGERIETATLKHGDIVRFDRQEFTLVGPEDIAKTMIRPADNASTPTLFEPPNSLEQATGEDPNHIDNMDCRPGIDINEDALQRLVAQSRKKHLGTNSSLETNPSLIVMTGSSMGKIIPLTNHMMTIGRKKADIQIDEKSVSTEHAQIVRQGGKWKVIDMMSANGIYLNGKKMQAAFLIPGDILRIGRVDLRFSNNKSKPTSAETAEQDHSTQTSPKTRVLSSIGGSKLSGWLYIAIGFGFVLVIGAYILSSR